MFFHIDNIKITVAQETCDNQQRGKKRVEKMAKTLVMLLGYKLRFVYRSKVELAQWAT